MSSRFWKVGACIATALALVACSGDDGAQGPAGPPGAQGPAGPPGPPGTSAPTPTAEPVGDLSGAITAVSIDASGFVTVDFTVTDAAGTPVSGARNFEFTIAKLVPETVQKPAYWQSYINRSTQSTTGVRVLRAVGERRVATEVAPGQYRYTFCTSLTAAAGFKYYGSGTEPANSCNATAVGRSGVLDSAAALPVLAALDLAYVPTAVHRIGIASRDGSGATLARYNAVVDFVPASLPALSAVKTRQVVTDASCGACHAKNSADRTKLDFVFTPTDQVHGNRRFEIALCVTCHNPETYDPVTSTNTAWKTLDMKVLIHDLHAAEFPQGGSFGGVSDIRNPTTPIPGVDDVVGGRPRFNGAPGVINCRNCHDNQNDKILPFQPANRPAADKIAWQTNISRQACQSCHDGTVGADHIVDFNNHFGVQSDNSQCTLCHGPGRSLPVNAAHTTPYSTPNNPDLYPGAKVVKYEIASVTVDAATGAPTVRFRVLVGDTEAALAPINLKSPPPGVCILANCQNGNAAAGLNFRVAWARPMALPVAPGTGPANPSPADWNNFGAPASGRNFWNGTTQLTPVGSHAAFDQPVGVTVNATLLAAMSDPDADGYHTVTLPSPARFPASPVYETLTLRAVALESYLVINNYNISGDAVMKGVDGTQSTLRRRIVDMANCETCHERIGFHSNAGRANNAEYCATCHNPENSSSNLFVGTAAFPLAPGGAAFAYSPRSNNFKDMIHSIHAGAFRKTNNPADPFNFIRGNPAGGGGNGPMVFENVVYPAEINDCKTCHLPNTYGVPTAAGLQWSTIRAAPDNGAAGPRAIGAVNPNAGLVEDTTGTLYDPLKSVRIGPVQAACGSCHNSAAAKIHYTVNSTGLGESCAVCHGAGAAFEAHRN